MEKLLTIVVPTYNMELYLGRCLQSLVLDDNNLFELVQVIVINDGSKDKSLNIALKYKDKYPSVFEIVDKQNGNYGSCVNKGLELAKGRFFRILDADDWFDTGQFELFINSIKNLHADVDVLITNYTIQGKRVQKEQIRKFIYNKVYLSDDLDFVITGNKQMLRMHAMTFRTQLLIDCNLKLQEGISYTDAEYCYYPYVKANYVMFLNINLYQYYVGREGQTVSKECVIKNYDNFYKVGKRMLVHFLSSNFPKTKKRNSLVDFISNSLFNIYCVYLVYLRNTTDEKTKIIREIETCVYRDNDLNKAVYRYTYKKIPFVALWRLFGIKISSII